jgi:hypothetical protein
MVLKYWERHQIEYHWDAIAVEYSVNGGGWTDAPAPSNSAALGCSAGDDVTGWDAISCTQSPPINACGYFSTKAAFNGPFGGGTTCTDWATSGTVTPYAHRCQVIDELNPGDSVQIRWRFSSDPGSEFAGFYLDDIAVSNVVLPNSCTTDTCAGQPDATACNDGSACSVGDACSGGVCTGVSPPPPAEVAGVSVTGQAGTILTWTALPGSVVYDVDSSTLSNLRSVGTSGAGCLANNVASATYTDNRANPAAGDGYYYLIRAQDSCGTGTFGTNSAGTPRLPTAGCP